MTIVFVMRPLSWESSSSALFPLVSGLVELLNRHLKTNKPLNLSRKKVVADLGAGLHFAIADITVVANHTAKWVLTFNFSPKLPTKIIMVLAGNVNLIFPKTLHFSQTKESPTEARTLHSHQFQAHFNSPSSFYLFLVIVVCYWFLTCI